MANYKEHMEGVNLLQLLIFLTVLNFSCQSIQEDQDNKQHPRTLLTHKEELRAKLHKLPQLSQEFELVKAEVDSRIIEGVIVPVPVDLGGGYTHEQHKRNYKTIKNAGVLYQLTGEEKYAEHVKAILFAYADLYPTLGLHPSEKSYSRGKLFWQCLNEANWLVYASQGYDCIYDWLSKEERDRLEKDLFRPFADFLSIENPQFFNRIHNHSIWAQAGVGMIGLVMEDQELIDRALYGLESDEIDASEKDNDGAFIKDAKVIERGFFAQLDNLLSPNGYYNEGPYYQRYAMFPCFVFAQALDNTMPNLKIFAYRDSILFKSAYALINLTDDQLQFFPINDAQKGMSLLSPELVSAVDITYHYGGQDPKLLSIARLQNRVLLDDAGLSVAEGLMAQKEEKFIKASVQFQDGADGKQGAIGVLRTEEGQSVVMKYPSHGLGHGHFDRLSFMYYDNGNEVLQDYGMARFVNIEQKGGGGYLKENNTWAKQSIAHNTLVINETSQFEGKFSTANNFHSDPYFFLSSDIKAASAKDTTAYPGTTLHRTLLFLDDDAFEAPVLVDIFRVNSSKKNQYDLPYNYLGQLLTTNLETTQEAVLKPLGNSFGYQHLWKIASGVPTTDLAQISWFRNNRFYTLSSVVQAGDSILFTQLGANDPNFNLRNDPSLILRRTDAVSTTFVSALESHGNYNPTTEGVSGSTGNIAGLSIMVNTDAYAVISVSDQSGATWFVCLSNNNAEPEQTHNIEVNKIPVQWTGPIHIYQQTIKKEEKQSR